MRGFQLWVNLPAKDKMTDPRYQEFDAAKIPSVQPAAGVTVKAIAGEVDDGRGGSVRGPIAQTATDPLYLDIALDAGAVWESALPDGHHAIAHVFECEYTLVEGDYSRTLSNHMMAGRGRG